MQTIKVQPKKKTSFLPTTLLRRVLLPISQKITEKLNSIIPEFPNFKPLEFSDKEAIEGFTKKFPPYSDFNFMSMWCWDIKDDMRISQLNGNLVVKFTDYTTGNPFYSFLGKSNVSDTAKQLLDLSVQEGLQPVLKLLPEVSVAEMDKQSFVVEEDRDNFDYMYSVDKLKTYDGNKLRSKRNFFNRFKKNYQYSVARLDLSNPLAQEQILGLFATWQQNKKLDDAETLNELKAFQRLFKASDDKSLVLVGMFIDNKLVGFVMNDLLADGYAILNFEKADEKYVGIYACLMLENAAILSQLNAQFLNFEQDLGIEGLRLGKQSFRPVAFLKKYTIRNT
ncbi:MAG: DUF2156 domain-containing protein [Candidatus Sungbacteria bacterium]|nr:DUF2156 domain-containing protein [Candidatus Sungbacteria bacterium]